MKRKPSIAARTVVVLTAIFAIIPTPAGFAQAPEPKVLRIGVIGLDTSHVLAFTKEFHRDPISDPALNGFRVVAAYPHGSPDIESSVSRIPKYTEEMETQHGVKIVGSIAQLLEQVDCVLLETNDGRPHLKQALEVFPTGKPVFIDKPVGSNLSEVIAIYRAAEHYKTPMFSSSSLRYSNGAQEIRGGAIGDVVGCDAYSPCSIEPTHVDLYWYGIHGVETLFTCMGAGCESVSHTSTDDFEMAVGRWRDGRIGTFRGLRAGKRGYGGTAFGSKLTRPIGGYDGYLPLVVQIAKFFRSQDPPVDAKETIEIYAFMQAALASKKQGGVPVTIADVMDVATREADELLKGQLSPK